MVIVQVASPPMPTVMFELLWVPPTQTQALAGVTGDTGLRQRPGVSLQAGAASPPGWCPTGRWARAVGRQREVRHRLGAAVVVDHHLAQVQLRRDVVIGDRAGRGLADADSDVAARLRAADADPGARRVAGRPSRTAPRCRPSEPAPQSTGLVPDRSLRPGAVGGQREVRHGRGAAVVVDHDLAQVQLGRDVVVGDRAGRLPPRATVILASVLGAADAAPGARRVAGRFVSDSVQVSALESAPRIHRARARRSFGVGPAAVSVKSATSAVPPLSFTTILTRWSWARCRCW